MSSFTLGGGHGFFCTSFIVYGAALTFSFPTCTARGRHLTASSDLPRGPGAWSELPPKQALSQISHSSNQDCVQSKFERLQAFAALLYPGPASGFKSCSPARRPRRRTSNLVAPDDQRYLADQACRPAGDAARRSFLQAVFCASLSTALAPALPALAVTAIGTTAPTEQLKVVQGKVGEGNKYSIAVPPDWERPIAGAGRTGQFDDAVFAAIDLLSGRGCSVSAVTVETLLNDAADDTAAMAGFVVSTFQDMGKPIYVAKLLTAREQLDPKGTPVGEVRDVVRDGDTLTYTLVKPFFVATSATTSKPVARVTRVKALFVRPSGRLSAPYLLIARASSTAATASCKPAPCLACRGLLCECPEPQCQLPDADPLDLAIVESFRLTA